LQAGDTIRVDPAEGQLWAYLAVRGGIEVEPVLGSRSTDTLSGIGPAPIADGAVFGVGEDPGTDLVTDQAPVRPPEPTVRLWSAPRTAWFRDGRDALVANRWTVSGDVSRVGVRLSAGDFARDPSAPSEMASEGLVAGAVQITPAGEPIVMLADHPTTGGYPVIGVVDPSDLAIVAQAMPGSRIRFTGAGRG
jgi:allophanate hydrolase subunit 2